MRSPKRILVVRTDRIGDVVLSTPLIRALRRSFPAAYIAALVQPYAKDLLLGNPHLNAILTDDAQGEHSGRKGFWRQVRTLRAHHFDTALLLLPTERLAWMLFATGIRRRVGVGFKLYEALTLMKTVSRRKYIPLRHEADYCLDLGRAVGAVSQDLSTETFVTDEEKDRARALLVSARLLGIGESDPSIVLIHPGHGRSAPNWKVDHYVELAAKFLRDPGVRVVVTGSPGERGYSASFSTLQSPHIADVIGKLTLRELMALISVSSVVVSASTGPMHLAASLGVPTVSMFCRMSAASVNLWGPKGNVSETVRPSEHYCSTRCPGDPHICQFEGGILPAEVYDQTIALMNQVNIREQSRERPA